MKARTIAIGTAIAVTAIFPPKLQAKNNAELNRFFGKLEGKTVLAQEAKGIVKVEGASITQDGNFSVAGGSAFLVGQKILDAVTKEGKWEFSEACLVNNDVYVLRFKFGVVMISDKSNAIAYRAFPAGIQKYSVLEPGKGEVVRVFVDGERITGRIVGPSNDKELKLESRNDDRIGITSGHSTQLK